MVATIKRWSSSIVLPEKTESMNDHNLSKSKERYVQHCRECRGRDTIGDTELTSLQESRAWNERYDFSAEQRAHLRISCCPGNFNSRSQSRFFPFYSSLFRGLSFVRRGQWRLHHEGRDVQYSRRDISDGRKYISFKLLLRESSRCETFCCSLLDFLEF